MTFFASAGLGGALIGAAGAVGGALISANAAKGAAGTQAAAADRATQAEREMFERQIALQEPWRQGGGLGLNSLLYGMGLSPGGTFTPGATPDGAGGTTMLQPGADGVFAPAAPPVQWDAPINVGGPTTMRDQYAAYVQRGGRLASPDWANSWTAGTLGADEKGGQPNVGFGSLVKPFSMADFQADPGYQFQLSEGEKALQRAKAASGGLGSGGYVKDALRFSQGLAAGEYGKGYDRYRLNQGDTFNRLAALAGIGQTATNQTSAAAGQYGSQLGSNIIGTGNAAAAGQIGRANALNQGIGQGISLYQQNQMLQQYPPYGMSPGGGPIGVPANPYYVG